MASRVLVHIDHAQGSQPRLHVWYDDSPVTHDLAPARTDAYGPLFEVAPLRPRFGFAVHDGDRWEGLDRTYEPADRGEVWIRTGSPFTYPALPAEPDPRSVAEALQDLRDLLPRGGYLPATGLGATALTDGRVLVGLFHPHAGQVYLAGAFNDWQSPGHPHPDPARFVALTLHRGGTWLTVTDQLAVGGEYRLFVVGGVPRDDRGRPFRNAVDPYARRLGPDFATGNPVVVDPSAYLWHDQDWRTPRLGDLVLYELSVAGFTEGDADVDAERRGRFAGVTQRLDRGYFGRLGVNALSVMPLAEVPSPQGPSSIGYDPSLFMAVERDFGSPDDLRALVDSAHWHGAAVVLDMVFNHTSSSNNPMWGLVPAGPDDLSGGLYFSGSTPWGNRVATERVEVQDLLIDACKLFLVEYHVDGFRFDYTHDSLMDHGFLRRLAQELRALRPGVLLIAENLPNQRDLDPFAQWSELFHDKVKALLREGPFEGQDATPDRLADALYYSRQWFAGHTDNVVNYCQSHDEGSVSHELSYVPWLDNPAAKDRKGRLGLFATMVALGQPMLCMGQEFNLDQPRNVVTVDWPADLDRHAFFGWTSRLVHLRRRYPGLRLVGADPASDGRLTWILGPWLDDRHGAGRAVLGWRSRPRDEVRDLLVVLLNFEPYAAEVDLELGQPGCWVKLADLDTVEDIAPAGYNSAASTTALHSSDGRFTPFVLPPSSGLLYKWEAPA